MSEYDCRRIAKWVKFYKIAREEYKSNPDEKWIFRGNMPGKRLKSSLDRAIQYYPKELKERKKAERRLLRDFKRRYHQYSSDAPKQDDYLEWFSIMQHYGAPTRLLDFTYSIYIAAYFALEYTNKKYSEVYAVRVNWAIEQSAKRFNGHKKAEDFFRKMIDDTPEDRRNFENYFMSAPPKEFVCPFNPFRLTERISLQNGVFMCPGNVNKTFEHNLKSLKGWNKGTNIMKFILNFDKEQIIKARESLYDLNITRATLFPGLEGFAKSLAIYPPKALNEQNSA
ncbi:FRG domain-containing protein [bacterium]|nr:MAG: FRG domain-containing protein [bacterium]